MTPEERRAFTNALAEALTEPRIRNAIIKIIAGQISKKTHRDNVRNVIDDAVKRGGELRRTIRG